eukprot:SAG22_NODE_854_length_6847_cov_3.834469_3_plen_696_part_00
MVADEEAGGPKKVQPRDQFTHWLQTKRSDATESQLLQKVAEKVHPEEHAQKFSAAFHRDLRNIRYEGDGLMVSVKFLGGVLLLTLSSFVIPVGDACGDDNPVKGEWPTSQLSFYISILPGIIVLFMPVPIFAYIMTDNFHHHYFPNHRHNARDEQTIQEGLLWSLALVVPMAILTMLFLMLWSVLVTGFPVPFTTVLGGFPGYILTFFFTIVLIEKTTGKDTDIFTLSTMTALFKIAVTLAIIVMNTFLYTLLASLTKSHPEYANLWVLLFGAVKGLAGTLLKVAFRKDFDKIIPFAIYVGMNTAVFPAVLLPSVVSIGSYVLVWILDALVLAISLRHLWVPVFKVWLSKYEIEKDLEFIEAAEKKLAKEEREKVQAERALADEDKKIEEMESQRRARVKRKLQKIQHSFTASKFEQEMKVMEYLDDEAKRNELEQKHHIDLDGDGDTGVMGMSATERSEEYRLAEEKRKQDEAATNLIKEQHELDEARKVAAVAQKMEEEDEEEERRRIMAKERLFSADHVMQTEFTILLTIIAEMTEFVVPLGVCVLECFLYFGWNPNAVPTLGALSPSDFLASMGAKLFIAFLQMGSCLVGRWIIDNCTEIRFMTVMIWAVKNYLEAVTISAAGVFIFCYMTLMPHMNFNIDILADIIVGTVGFKEFDKMTDFPGGCLAPNATDHRIGVFSTGGNETNSTFG